ncbi:MAG: hypothetical protein ACK4GN_00545 [Runella sp.]
MLTYKTNAGVELKDVFLIFLKPLSKIIEDLSFFLKLLSQDNISNDDRETFSDLTCEQFFYEKLHIHIARASAEAKNIIHNIDVKCNNYWYDNEIERKIRKILLSHLDRLELDNLAAFTSEYYKVYNANVENETQKYMIYYFLPLKNPAYKTLTNDLYKRLKLFLEVLDKETKNRYFSTLELESEIYERNAINLDIQISEENRKWEILFINRVYSYTSKKNELLVKLYPSICFESYEYDRTIDLQGDELYDVHLTIYGVHFPVNHLLGKEKKKFNIKFFELVKENIKNYNKKYRFKNSKVSITYSYHISRNDFYSLKKLKPIFAHRVKEKTKNIIDSSIHFLLDFQDEIIVSKPNEIYNLARIKIRRKAYYEQPSFSLKLKYPDQVVEILKSINFQEHFTNDMVEIALCYIKNINLINVKSLKREIIFEIVSDKNLILKTSTINYSVFISILSTLNYLGFSEKFTDNIIETAIKYYNLIVTEDFWKEYNYDKDILLEIFQSRDSTFISYIIRNIVLNDRSLKQIDFFF